jgi:signal transduction histidine kinase/DNA-binding response OmpR family regulator
MPGQRILVVDDEPQILMLIGRFLRRAGYDIEAAESGVDALERMQGEALSERGPFPLVLSDLKMPQVGGLDVLREVRERYDDTLVVLITGFASTDSAIAALRQGAYDYLTKPLDLDDLLSTVRRALEHRALVQQNKRLVGFLQEQNLILESLHREERLKSRRLRQVNAIARQITAILDVHDLIQTVLDLIAPAFDFVDPSFGLLEGDRLLFWGGALAGQVVQVEESAFWRLTEGGVRPWVGLADDEGQERSAPYDLIFPLQAGEQTVGFWVAGWREDALSRQRDLPYLEALAAQTVVVLQNARLYALARRADEMAFLNRVSWAANRSLDLEETVRGVLSCVCSTLDAAVAEICLLGEQGQVERVFSLASVSEAAGEMGYRFQPLDPASSLLGSDFVQRVGQQPLIVQEAADAEPYHCLLGVALSLGEQQIGVLGVASRLPQAYDHEQGRLLQVVGGLAATAIENAQLFEQVESGRRTIMESRDTLLALFDGILEGIYIVDRDRRVLAANRTLAHWAGKSFSDLVGQPAEHAFPLSQRAMVLIEETFESGEPRACTERQRVPVGDMELFVPGKEAGTPALRVPVGWTEWEIHTYPIARLQRRPADDARVHSGRVRAIGEAEGDVQAGARDPGSYRVDRVIVVVRDVTEQRLLEASLAQSEKLAALGTLAAGIAHEINNPLTVISANAQILCAELLQDHPYYDSIELINRASDRASRIVRSLLDFSRSERFEFVLADLNVLLQEAISLVELQFRKANIQIGVELDPGLPSVLVSPDDLHVVWLNLLLNARDAIQEAGREEGRIGVSAHRRGDWVVVHISDNGVGIPEAVIKHVYDPFFTTKAPGRGTGLGLFNCYRTIARHGGKIDVESELGKGTVFHVSLPVHEADSTASAAG